MDTTSDLLAQQTTMQVFQAATEMEKQLFGQKKTREAIWQAMLNRRTYAVTGDKIKCEFTVNGNPMGAIVKNNHESRAISFKVEADYAIDKNVVYKNLKPYDITEGLLLENKKTDTKFKFRIEMGWGNSTALFQWLGSVKIDNGSILAVQPCWRGRSILSPTEVLEETGDDANATDDRMRLTAMKIQCFILILMDNYARLLSKNCWEWAIQAI